MEDATAPRTLEPAELLRRRAVLDLAPDRVRARRRPPRADAGRRDVQPSAPSSSTGPSARRLPPGRAAGRQPLVATPTERNTVRARSTSTAAARESNCRARTTTTSTATATCPTTSATRTPTASPTTTSRTAACTDAYWTACYASEKPYYIDYAGTDLDDADTDGDGVRDGADDQDHDDIPNLDGASRIAAVGLLRRREHLQAGSGRAEAPGHEPPERLRPREPVQPVPADRESRTCPRHRQRRHRRSVRRLAELVLAATSPSRTPPHGQGPPPSGPWSLRDAPREADAVSHVPSAPAVGRARGRSAPSRWPGSACSASSFTDYEVEAAPAFAALAHGDFGRFLELCPAYGGSLIMRAPFALARRRAGRGRGRGLPRRRDAVPAGRRRAGRRARREPARPRRRPRHDRDRGAGCARPTRSRCARSTSATPRSCSAPCCAPAPCSPALRGRSTLAGVLLGLAIANKAWAVLAVGPVLLALPADGGARC